MNTPSILNNADPVEKYLHVPHDQRWDLLKATIIRIFMEEDTKIARLAQRMKEEYGFDAQVPHYRYRFKKWGIKKRITTEEKGAVITALGKRSRSHTTSTSNATIDQGGFAKNVNQKNLKRYINQSIRQGQSWNWTPGLFLRYDLPYTALVRSLSAHNYPSPSAASPATPSYLTLNSPEEVISPSAAQNNPSPTMQLVQKKILLDRARLFLEGREYDLMAQMSRDERRSTATWLHDLWMYSFMTAKYWGRGPKTWTISLINFKSFAGEHALSTLGQGTYAEYTHESLSPQEGNISLEGPTQLCRWSIHCKPPDYDSIPSSPVVNDGSEEQFDVDDESTWKEWTGNDCPRDVSSTIEQGLRDNVFTTIQAESLPFDAGPVINAVQKSPEELTADALGFAIMSRNVKVIFDIFGSYDDDFPESFSNIFPFHLAAAFLDGSKVCCGVMEALVNCLHESNSIALNYTDNLGHTVLDTLFITILRSHSTISPHVISDAFDGRSSFPGQDVDPCGRWDADSPCIRKLHALGKATIPVQWKHMFCHTAVQAICHCISVIYMGPSRPNINTPSGLFVKRCSNCGLSLQVGPLHALVLTAFYLAQEGMPRENLFGMVACLVCLLTFRADPCSRSDISIPALLGHELTDECQHASMNSAELASKLPCGSWSPEIKMGWSALIVILQHDIAKRQDHVPTPNDKNEGLDHIYPRDTDNDKYFNDEHVSTTGCRHLVHASEFEDQMILYCGNLRLGRIWAAIQAELLTYRRLSESDHWLSPEFKMSDLLRGLQENDDRYILQLFSGAGSSQNRLMAHSYCGLFGGRHPGCVIREEACAFYYSNLDDWKRTTFIEACEWEL